MATIHILPPPEEEEDDPDLDCYVCPTCDTGPMRISLYGRVRCAKCDTEFTTLRVIDLDDE